MLALWFSLPLNQGDGHFYARRKIHDGKAYEKKERRRERGTREKN